MMADNIVACMNGTVSVPLVLRVVRRQYNPVTEDNLERDREILTHYDHLAYIEDFHKGECEEETREYIRKAQNGSPKPTIAMP